MMTIDGNLHNANRNKTTITMATNNNYSNSNSSNGNKNANRMVNNENLPPTTPFGQIIIPACFV